MRMLLIFIYGFPSSACPVSALRLWALRSLPGIPWTSSPDAAFRKAADSGRRSRRDTFRRPTERAAVTVFLLPCGLRRTRFEKLRGSLMDGFQILIGPLDHQLAVTNGNP